MFGKFLGSISSGKKKLVGPKESLASERHAQNLLHPGGLSVPELNPNRLRVVVFRDDKGMKQPIFDSQQLASEEGEEQCTRSLCDMRHGECLDSSLSSSSNGGVMTGSSSTHSAGWATQSSKTRRGLLAKRQSTDSELLGEMMFGSMPMKVIGNTVKVHYIRSTDQLMLSKVFTSQRKPLAQCSITDFSDSCPLPSYSPSRSMERSFGNGKSKTSHNLRHVSPDVTRPSSSTLSVPISSPYPNSPSTHSPPSPINSLTVPSLASSLSRRIQRSRSTSLENASELYRKVLKPLDQPANGSTRKKRKYAIGFIICLSELGKTDIRHFQSFIFSHFTLIDAHLERLKMGVEEAYGNRHQGVAAETFMSKSYETFLQDFLSLYSTPRIESPAWLSLVSHVDRRKEVCMHFMEELAAAIMELDTKETKFFLSTLLTAVLAHHLAWIFTVSHHHSPSDGNRHGGKHLAASKSLGVLAESHPYNPLWAQLGDLFGSVSNPLKICRTVVTGQSSSVVSRLLYLLTYFIRCSEVEPGFSSLSLDAASPPSSTIPSSAQHQSRTAEVSIPTSSSATMSSGATSSYDVSQLDETDMFGSRASSVTVISENDRQSLFSPFASPVNQGPDTPIVSIRPHPFSIRTTPLSLTSPSDYRKGSQSESDSMDSLSMRGQQEVGSNTSLRPMKKTGSASHSSDPSTSQGAHPSLRKTSPLLSSARQTGFVTQKATEALDDRQGADQNNICHYGNPTMCATLACCESMGMCPLQDGFLIFDPSRNCARGAGTGLSCQHQHLLGYGTEDNLSISQLATCGLLGPSPSLDSSSSSCAPPSHSSCTSSLDSGYGFDQSWSLTNSSRNSCTDMGSLVSKPHPLGSMGDASAVHARCLCGEEDSGRGSQCSCPREKGCRRALFFPADSAGQEVTGGRFGYSSVPGKCCSSSSSATPSPARISHRVGSSHAPLQERLSVHLDPSCGGGRRNMTTDVSIPSSDPLVDYPNMSTVLRGNGKLERSVPLDVDSDPTSSLFPRKSKRSTALMDSGPASSTVVTSDPTSTVMKSGPTSTVMNYDLTSTIMNSDPTSSMFPVKISRLTKLAADDLSSPPSPTLTGEMSADPSSSTTCDSPLEVFAVSSDPLTPLPPRKIKNHIRTVHHAKASRNDIVTGRTHSPLPQPAYISGNTNRNNHITPRASGGDTTCDFVGLDSPTSALYTSDSDLCPDDDNLLEASSVTSLTTETRSVPVGSVPCQNFSTGSVPVSQGGRGSLSLLSSHLTLHNPLQPRIVVGDTPPSATGSICSEADSGRGTKSSLKTGEFDTRSLSQISEISYEFEPDSAQDSLSTLSLLRHRVNVRANSSPPIFGNQPQIRREEEEVCCLGGTCRSYPVLFRPEGTRHRQNNSLDSRRDNQVMREGAVENWVAMDARSVSEPPPGSLQQQLHLHDQSLMMGVRPSTLEQFDNFTDVPLPDLEEFHLDMHSSHQRLDEAAAHRHQMSDFGHSLFVGVSPRYLPDFVLHGTTESADQAFQDKLLKDLGHAVKYSIIDEPVEYGVGIVADTDNWTVKVMAASKSVQTSDLIYETRVVQAAKCVKQMLSSVKNMHCLRMPPEFCLSYVEDSLMSLNERSIMLADTLLEAGDANFTEVLPKVAESLSISPSDISLLLPVAAVNCQDPDMAARFNYLHMQQTLGKHFI